VNKTKVLVVDDEESIRRFLRITLTAQSYTILEAGSGHDALTSAFVDKPDIVILDLGLPDIDGVEVIKLMRQWTKVPIIILSVRDSESDKIAGLDAGADDYLTKPFSVGELLARLRAALRRANQKTDQRVFVVDRLKVDIQNRVVNIGETEIQLTPNEYELLKALVTHEGQVLTHRYLLREVWGPEYQDEYHILHVNISNLRRKIESDPARPQLIITEPGVGYRLKAV
jgi:two-component system, OmpR family, KDP operon response regulator KdpE